MRLMDREVFCGYEQCHCAGAEAEREKERRAEAEEARKAMLDKAMRDWKRAGVPERYVDLDHPLAAEIAEGMERGQWAYLWGDVGTRKTTCAAAVAKRLSGGKRSVLMAPMYRILDEIQRSFRDGGDPLKRYAEVRYLIVDDLGKRRPTGFVLDSLFQLIDQRYSAMLPTLVTTQYRPSDLVRRLAEQGDPDTAKAIVSRLRHGARLVEFDGPDGRLR
ncbi:ATP-binding protein [Collinsella bouchesdurhonensis]|uniref:ATP-binding protein n=1 Tax=Collinsella bouchesdurhonensis TaxID=1907654 RepID=UPI003568EBF9